MLDIQKWPFGGSLADIVRCTNLLTYIIYLISQPVCRMPIHVMFDKIKRKLLISCVMSIGSIDELRSLR